MKIKYKQNMYMYIYIYKFCSNSLPSWKKLKPIFIYKKLILRASIKNECSISDDYNKNFKKKSLESLISKH